MKDIHWNDQAELYLSEGQRQAAELGLELGIDGSIEADELGNAWLVVGEHRRCVGTCGGPGGRSSRDGQESAAAGKPARRKRKR